MPKKLTTTTWIWVIYAFLMLISIMAVISSSVQMDINRGGYFITAGKHFVYYLGAIAAMLGVIAWGKKGLLFLYRFVDLGFYLTILIIFVTVFMGKEANEARRWLVIPGINMSINTFEIAKFVIIAYFAKKLTIKYPDTETRKKQIYTALLAATVVIGLITIQNLSTGILLVSTIYIMLWLARMPKDFMKNIHLALLGVLFLATIIIIAQPNFISRSHTWHERLHKYIFNTYTENDQAMQSKVAISKTGLLNFKPGQSDYKYIIPLSYTDYIFAIIGEEMSLVAILLPILYLWLFKIISNIAFRQKKPFLTLLVLSFGILITLQAFLHMLVNVGLLPETGQTLPLISLGGTSLLINSIMLGVIIAANKLALSDEDFTFSDEQKNTTDQQDNTGDQDDNPFLNDIVIDNNIL